MRLGPGEIPAWDRFQRPLTNLLSSLERRTRQLFGGRAGCTNVLEVALARLAGGDEASVCQFFLPRSIAEGALGNRLQLSVPTHLLTHRLHDWVRAGSEIAHTGDFFLSTAQWTPLLSAVADCAVLEEARQLEASGLNYRQTDSFADYLRCKDTSHPLVRNKVRLDTEAKVCAYFERFVALFESIAQHGLLPLQEARRLSRKLDRPSSVRGLFTSWGEKDLGIALAADHGMVLLPGGKHRLAVARVLGLQRIPARVRLLHASWLQQCGPVLPGEWPNTLVRGWTAACHPPATAGPEGELSGPPG